jgi:hypothetical protein
MLNDLLNEQDEQLMVKYHCLNFVEFHTIYEEFYELKGLNVRWML